jgi:hypothetical protein
MRRNAISQLSDLVSSFRNRMLFAAGSGVLIAVLALTGGSTVHAADQCSGWGFGVGGSTVRTCLTADAQSSGPPKIEPIDDNSSSDGQIPILPVTEAPPVQTEESQDR